MHTRQQATQSVTGESETSSFRKSPRAKARTADPEAAAPRSPQVKARGDEAAVRATAESEEVGAHLALAPTSPRMKARGDEAAVRATVESEEVGAHLALAPTSPRMKARGDEAAVRATVESEEVGAHLALAPTSPRMKARGDEAAVRATVESEEVGAHLALAPTSPRMKARGDEAAVRATATAGAESEEVAHLALAPTSPRVKARAAMEVELSPRAKARAEDSLGEPPRLRQANTSKERFLGTGATAEPGEQYEEEGEGGSLRAHYEQSLDAERVQVEEKLLALRIRKWQHGVRMSEEETPEPAPPAEPQHVEPEGLVHPHLEAVDERGTGDHADMSAPTSPRQSQDQASAASPKARLRSRPGELDIEASMAHTSPRIKGRAVEVGASPRTRVGAEKMLFERTTAERELQLSRENLSELKSESEKFVSEEEALNQRILRWQENVLMEQEEVVKPECDWEEGYSEMQAEKTTDAGREAAPQPEAVRSRKTSSGKTAKEKFLQSEAVPSGFQDQLAESLQWPPAEAPPTEGRETRLQRDSEYFVSEEEALAQRILKWHQDGGEQEEVAELESEWSLDTQGRPPGSGMLSRGVLSPSSELPPPTLGGGASSTATAAYEHAAIGESSCIRGQPPACAGLPHQPKGKDRTGLEASPVQRYSPTQTTAGPFESPDKPSGECSPLGRCLRHEGAGHDAETSRSRQGYATTADKSISQRFQSDVREERAMREETGASRERQQKDLAGVKREDVSRESMRTQQGADTSEESMELGAVQKDERRVQKHERRVQKHERRVQDEAGLKELSRMKEKETSARGSRPVFVKEVSSAQVRLGEMTEFTCRFQGDPLPSVTWLKDGHPLAHNPDYDIMSQSNTSKLTVFCPTADHEGTYDSVIANQHGKSICSGTLHVSGRKGMRMSEATREVVVTEGADTQEGFIEAELETFTDSGRATLQVPQAAIHQRRSSGESFGSSPVEIRITAATPLPETREDIREDAPQREDIREDAPQREDIREDTPQREDIREDTPQRDDATQREDVPQREDIREDAPQREDVREDAPQREDIREDAPQREDIREDAPQREDIREDEPQREDVREDAPQREDIREDAPQREDIREDAPQREDIREDEDASQTAKHKFTFSFDAAGEAAHAVSGLENISRPEGDMAVVAGASEPVQPAEGAGFTPVRRSPVGSTEDAKKAAIMHTKDTQSSHAPSELAKAPTPRPSVSREPPRVSGCGLQASAAVIKVSQIKQAFESDSPVALQTQSPPEEQSEAAHFPEEFIPAVAISLDQQDQVLDSLPAGGAVSLATAMIGNPSSPNALPGSPEASHPASSLSRSRDVEQGADSAESHGELTPCVEDVRECPGSVRPTAQQPAPVAEHVEACEVEMPRGQPGRTFDKTGSFFPFKPDKVPAVKRTVRTSAPVEEAVEPEAISKPLRHEKHMAGEGSSSPRREAEADGTLHSGEELVSDPEPSLDSGVFLSMPESQADVTEVAEEVAGDEVEPHVHIKSEDGGIEVMEPEPATLVVEPRGGDSVEPLEDAPAAAEGPRRQVASVQEGDEAGAGAAAAAAGSMEEEEVTFGAVYDFYNPPADWGRPLSPESEMSIEVGSTVSEDLGEMAERFYTPGSSTEVSQPIAESFQTPKSHMSFRTPSSDTSGGFRTPKEYPFSPMDHKRPSTGGSSERFFSPMQFLMSPGDEGIETVDDNLYLTKGLGPLGLATLQEKVQGIPPAFLKPLVKKRVFEKDSLTFYAEVFGLPSPQVSWFCNGKQLLADDRVNAERDGDSISLTIHNVTKADQGEYICEAVNYVGEARSVALVAVVSQEVRFTPALPNVTHQHVMEFDVEDDDSSRSTSPQEILLEVELDESDVKEFERQIKIITIPEYTADNKSMIISLNVLPSNYEECTVDFVTQEHDDLRIAFEVTEMPPRFINPICDMETAEGTAVMFECSLMGIPSPIVSWFKGDKKIPHSNNKYLCSSDGDNHSLKICKVAAQDSGVYTCRAINVVGETLCRASLVVVNANALSGKTRGRELTAVSLGSARVQPQKFDLLVGNSSFDSEQVSEIELEFEFEQEADESQRAVRLVAKTAHEVNERGEKYVSINFNVFAEPAKDDKIEFKGKSSDMCSFQFLVTESPPRCVIPLTNITAAVGTPVILQCLVSGKPSPTAEWYKDGNPVTSGRCILQEKTAGHFNLLITNASQSDGGEYKCVIQNTAGYIETAALLKVF
ncbi:titin-like [Pseudochaenichthys georgianus]|uniref:titin-like n=1 Tax=Pseudochaenichthys georgianus TaxID=52239 RepID=UPI0039C45934